MSEDRDPKGEPTTASPALRPAARPGAAPLKGSPRAPERPVPAPRGKLASTEEISSSLLLPDDEPKGAPTEADAEELSGSLLLDDPGGPRGPERAVIMPAVTRPGSARPGGPRPSPSVKPPVPRSVKPPPPKSVKPPTPTSAKPPPPPSIRPPPPRAAAGFPAPPPQGTASARVPDALPNMPLVGDTNGVHHPPNGLAEGVEAAPAPVTPVAADDDRMHEAKTLPIGAVPAIVLERIALRSPGPVDEEAAEGEGMPATEETDAEEPAATEHAPDATAQAAPELPALPLHHAGVRGDGVRRFVEGIVTVVRERQRRLFADELPPWFLWASTGAGIAAGVGAVVVITSLLRPAPAIETLAPEASTVAALPPPPEPTKIETPAAATIPPSAAPAPAPATPPQACKLNGAPAVLAPAAVLSSGVEARALGEDDVALGFASNEHEAVGLLFHPFASSTTAAGTATQRARNPVRRVTPLLASNAKGGLELAVDGDAKGDALIGRRTLPFDPPIQIGTTSDGLAWAKRGGAPAGKLWALDGDGDVQALRSAVDPSAPTGNVAIAFRRGDAIDIGVFAPGDSPAPNGDLVRIDGLGGGVGSPAIAINDGVVFAVWADRASNDAPWSLRWVRFQSGHAPGTPMTFTPPPGGKGDQAMSPSVAALPDKRFLLVWAEGHVSDHDVRALTLSEDGKPIGDPLDVSSAGSNAGQGQAAVTAAGHGLVAFLESGDKGFHVAGTRIECSGP